MFGNKMKLFKNRNLLVILFVVVFSVNSGCKKLVQIPGPSNSITTTEAFNTIEKATSVVTGIYSDMSLASFFVRYANGLTTIDAGLSADELTYFGAISPFQNNSILPTDGDISYGFWTPAYFDIYSANAAIDGLTQSATLPAVAKNQLIGECKFIRAFCYFYLVNLFGDVPLVTSISFARNSLLSRTPSADVYRQIITDLKDAQNLLPNDYSAFGNERTRATSWAANALLARTFLYKGIFDSAELYSSAVINQTGLYGLTDLSGTFLKNSFESILQLEPINANLNATAEGNQFIPRYFTKDYPPDVVDANWPLFVPTYPLTSQLLNAFDSGDLRKSTWIDSTGQVNGTNYYYPSKYKIGQGAPGGINEYYMVLRLAEQYLIRAEARAQQNDIAGAQSDLNIVRARSGLGPTNANDVPSLLTAIVHERQVELFAEWGHRWLDLKRIHKADEILSTVKGTNWQTTDQLWPIPQSELVSDPNLRQNTGY